MLTLDAWGLVDVAEKKKAREYNDYGLKLKGNPVTAMNSSETQEHR